MGIRIGNGVRFRDGDPDRVMSALEGMRPRFAAIRSDERAAWIAATATKEADARWHAGASGGVDHVDAAIAEMRERRAGIEALGRRDVAVDLKIEVVLIPSEVGLLGFPIVESDALRAEMAAILDPFPYWDGTDGPDGMDDGAWDERRRIWLAALEPGGGVPGRCGPSFVDDDDAVPDEDAILARVPDRTSRARARVRDLETTRRFQVLQAARAPETRCAGAVHDVMEAMDLHRTSLADPTALAAHRARIAEEAARLPEADRRHLRGGADGGEAATTGTDGDLPRDEAVPR